jgi:hypothetical protein
MTTLSPGSQGFEIREKLASLESQLVAATPNIAELLRDIHASLKKDPDVVTLLSEEECSTLVRGLSKQTNTEIATKMAKKGATKSLKKMTVADL